MLNRLKSKVSHKKEYARSDDTLSRDMSRLSTAPSTTAALSSSTKAGYDAPPPPYTSTTPRSQQSPLPNNNPLSDSSAHRSSSVTTTTHRQVTASTADDPYAFLSSFDTVFLVDDSGSMAGSRWRETASALESITPLCVAHDADGIDLYFLNTPSSSFHHNISSAATVREVFSTVRPGGGTPTGQKLNAILRPYLQRCERDLDGTKPLNLIVITDGEPSDDVESPLIAAAKRLDKLDAPAWQVGVQFFQVGRDEDASRHLRQLDDELAEIAGEDIRDMVDTVPFTGGDGGVLTGDGILKVVLGAVNRRLDRRRNESYQ